jgi:predicted RNA-binding Zn-ribbon protein involved in translation (DUF1610 family)
MRVLVTVPTGTALSYRVDLKCPDCGEVWTQTDEQGKEVGARQPDPWVKE